MKKIFILISVVSCSLIARGQEFTKQLTVAKSSYAAGKLDDARFAMQQMLQELDIVTGKEILKKLPAKLQEQNAVHANDNVTGASGWAGVIIHREYGSGVKKIELEIIGNSPMIASINAILSLPMIGNSGDSKVIKISGYKALVTKTTGENEKAEYEVQLPIQSSLITVRAPGYTQDQVIAMANLLPVSEIAKMIQ